MPASGLLKEQNCGSQTSHTAYLAGMTADHLLSPQWGQWLTSHLVVQKFLMQAGIPTETAARVYRRYLKLEPTHAEEYIAYLRSKVGSRI